MLRIGLTGGIGAGKSAVSATFSQCGGVVVDGDVIAREVVEPGTEGLAALVEAFGADILLPDGALNRPALAAKAFSSDETRATLNGIVHPLVAKRRAELIAAVPEDSVVVEDIPLLVESGMAPLFPLVVVVFADVEVRVSRLVGQRGMADDDARARIAAQAADEQRRAVADVWLDNSGTPEALTERAREVWDHRITPFAVNLSAGQVVRPPARLVSADPAWPDQAARIVARLKTACGAKALRVDHIGSTAVPGLDAKDAIDIQVTVESLTAADELAAALRSAGYPRIDDVTSDVAVTTPQVEVTIDRDKAAAMGVNASQIENALYDAYGQRWVSTIYGSVNEYKVLLELLPKYQADPNALSMLYFKNGTGRLIPLQTLANVVTDIGPQTINHYGELPAATVSFNLKPGAALGTVVTKIQDLAERELPMGITTQFQGAAKSFQSSLGNLVVLLIIAVMVVYIVLGILYESYIHPMTILSGLPSAGFGALLTLLLFHIDLNIYAFVGLIMLIGIVEKNAIMQIDFALEVERKEGKPPLQAIYEGCMIRFRPIMMTTMAALLGGLPVALGFGAGGESRRPLGMAVVGGLAFSQMMTLYLTPVVYTYMCAILEKWRAMSRQRTSLHAEPAMLAGD